MKQIIIVIFFLAFAQTTAFAQSATAATAQKDAKGITTTTLKVSGNCGMCKRRIEEACVRKGVKSAKWDAKTGVLAISFSTKTTLEKIENSIAKAGYDTEHAKATDKTYNKLPQCCQYRAAGASKH